MLVVSRRAGEQVFLPLHRITLTVLDTSENRVRLGIDAPLEAVVCHRDADSASAAEPTASTVSSPSPSRSPLRLLVADGDEASRTEYATYLRRQGFLVTVATNALDCLTQLRHSLPDALILDPDVLGGGDSVVEQMQQESRLRDIPVIILTYGRDRGAIYRLSAFRVRDMQFKPLAPRKLSERIKSILGCGTAHSDSTAVHPTDTDNPNDDAAAGQT